MASPSPSPASALKVSTIANIPALENFLTTIGPSSHLYLDLRGDNLRRNGSLDIITIFAPPDEKVRVIDVKTLGGEAFTTPSKKDNKVTLKSILENPSIGKYLWDARNDAYALKVLHNVVVSGVIDIQLLENLTRPGNCLYVHDLDKAIQDEMRLDHQKIINWTNTKMAVCVLASGAPGIFSTRPLTHRMLQYCAGHACHLPSLQKLYEKRPAYKSEWLQHLEKASVSRMKKGRSSGYKPEDSGHRFGPWGASPAYFFKNRKSMPRRGISTAPPKARTQSTNLVPVGTGGQTARCGLGSTLVSKLVSLMRMVIP